MTLFYRLVMWWWEARNGAAEVDSGYPQRQSDDPIPDGFDLRDMQPPLSFLDTFPGEQEDDK